MPQWKNYERISFDYYDVLNVHISSDNQLDKTKDNIKNFARAYFNRFGEMPNEDAYYGYDMTLYMGKMLIKHGSQFQTQIDAEPFMGLSTGFDFESVYDISDASHDFCLAKPAQCPRARRDESRLYCHTHHQAHAHPRHETWLFVTWSCACKTTKLGFKAWTASCRSHHYYPLSEDFILFFRGLL